MQLFSTTQETVLCMYANYDELEDD